MCAVAAGRRGLEEKTLARERRSRKLTYRRQRSRRQGDAADVGCPIRGKHHMAAGLEGFGRSGRGRGRRGGQPDAGGRGGGGSPRGVGTGADAVCREQRERGAGAGGWMRRNRQQGRRAGDGDRRMAAILLATWPRLPACLGQAPLASRAAC